MEYVITEEQYKSLKHFNSMFKYHAENLKTICSKEKADVTVGFELGHLNKCLWEYFSEMGDTLGEVYGQHNSIILREIIEEINKLKIESTLPDSRRTGDYRIGLEAAITEISNFIK